jgi:hypothetical protein
MMDVGKNGRGPLMALLEYMDVSHEKFKSWYPTSGPRFEAGTSKTRSRRAKLWTASFRYKDMWGQR